MEINRTIYKDVSKGLKVKFELETLKKNKKTEQPVQIAEVHRATAELLSNCSLQFQIKCRNDIKINYFQKQTKYLRWF